MSKDEYENGQPEAEEARVEGQEACDSPDESPGTAIGEEGQVDEASGSWKEKYLKLESKCAELSDQFLRKAADFENFRKRMQREKLEISDYANQNLLLDLIPIIDDFERAIKSAEISKDFAGFYEGIRMIENALLTQLENKWGLKRFDSEGEPFDPNRHEALQVEKTSAVSEATVKEEYSKGYALKERVIRYAKVTVLMPQDEEQK
jgi:molecular chaperone GrpE